jgi:hypothetical protein
MPLAAALLLGAPLGLGMLSAELDLSRIAPGAAPADEIPLVLTADSTGHLTLSPAATSPSTATPGSQTMGSLHSLIPDQAVHLDPDSLHRSVRENMNRRRLRNRLSSSVSPRRLQQTLHAPPSADSLSQAAGVPLDPTQLENAVRIELRDSLGRTLRQQLAVDQLDRNVRIRITLPAAEWIAARRGGETEGTAGPSSTAAPSLPTPPAPAPDSVLSRALTQTLQDTTVILGRNTTVVRPAASASSQPPRRTS